MGAPGGAKLKPKNKMNKTQITEKMRILEKEIKDLVEEGMERGREVCYKYLEEMRGEKKEEELKKLRVLLCKINEEKNKGKKFFKLCGDYGTSTSAEILCETDNYFLCYRKGYSGDSNYIEGSSHCHPAFMIVKRDDDYTQKEFGCIFEIEFKRGERKVALEKAKEKLKELSNQSPPTQTQSQSDCPTEDLIR